MASVRLDFLPPTGANIAALRIYESSSSTGSFVEIDRVTDIGTAPEYISTYKTTQATSASDWFFIAWEDDAGSVGPGSSPVKGGTAPFVAQVVERALQRDSGLDRTVVTQEAEVAIQMALGDDVDPYDGDLTVSYKLLSGMVYLTLARCYSFDQAVDSDQAKIGLVSFQASSGGPKALATLMALASAELGLNQSRILQIVNSDRRRRLCAYEVFEA